MSLIDGGADAPAEVTPTPEVIDAPEPVVTSEPTPRAAIDRAFESLDKADADEVAEAEGRKRGPDGRFLPREGDSAPAGSVAAPDTENKPAATPAPTNFVEPPTRFSPDAKAAWKEAPEPVRAEITRAIKELEQGIEKYRTDATEFDGLRPFSEMAKSQGTDLKTAMSHYIGMENMLRRDPVAAFNQIAQNLGIPLRDIAAQVVGQKPDQAASANERTIIELRQTVAELQKQVGGVSKTIEQQRADGVMAEVAGFASKPEFARFDELAGDIKIFLSSGRVDRAQPLAKQLSDAYALAERLNPAPVPASAPPTATQPPAQTDLKPQTPKGQKQLSGAPNSGSNPANRKAPTSSREAIDRAFDTMGLG